jgi:hypothetical protein
LMVALSIADISIVVFEEPSFVVRILFLLLSREDRKHTYDCVMEGFNQVGSSEELRPGDRILIAAVLAALVIDVGLYHALDTGILFSTSIDRDVAWEMLKAIVEVDGFFIGFAGVLATLVLSGAPA